MGIIITRCSHTPVVLMTLTAHAICVLSRISQLNKLHFTYMYGKSPSLNKARGLASKLICSSLFDMLRRGGPIISIFRYIVDRDLIGNEKNVPWNSTFTWLVEALFQKSGVMYAATLAIDCPLMVFNTTIPDMLYSCHAVYYIKHMLPFPELIRRYTKLLWYYIEH
jgi:hypothetical protein